MIAVIVPCTSDHACRECEALLSYGNSVIAVGNPDFIPPDCTYIVHSSDIDRWVLWDEGIDMAVALGYTSVAMVAGEGVPQRMLAEMHDSALAHDFPLVTVGRCLERNIGWADRRPNVFNKTGTLVGNVSMVTNGMIACGNIGMNIHAINRMRALHRKAFDSDRVFCQAGFGHRIGYAAWLMNISMWYLPTGQNAIKLSDDYVPDGQIGPEDSYVARIRTISVTLDML